MLVKIYNQLLKEHGSRKWWPVSGFTEPKEWEICIGAILTQNTAWRNVEKALVNLDNADCRTVDDILKMDIRKLRRLIRPSGFFNQKA
ncbi:MAG: endonuclease, partial [Candidatus Aenigmatarchaeota archaeon]